MSYASWAHVSPTSGSGTESGFATNWTADVHTGRNQRTTSAQYSTGSITRTANIIQAGADLFINVTNPSGTTNAQHGGSSTYNASSSGGSLTIQGTTNAKSLNYTLQSIQGVDESLALTLPATYTANSNTTTKGANITGDPGQTAAFGFSIPLTIPENTTVGTLGCMVVIEGSDGNGSTVTWNVTIIVAAGEPYLFLNKMDSTTDAIVNLTAAGTPAQTITVFSNTSWNIS